MPNPQLLPAFATKQTANVHRIWTRRTAGTVHIGRLFSLGRKPGSILELFFRDTTEAARAGLLLVSDGVWIRGNSARNESHQGKQGNKKEGSDLHGDE